MKLKDTIRKFFAVLLIIVFSLKAGMGLYLHNSIHAKNNSCTSLPGSTEIKFACSCVTDFYLPFTEASQQKINLPSFTYGEYTLSYTSSLFLAATIYHSLRAPPIFS
jgi:hypothetical protein